MHTDATEAPASRYRTEAPGQPDLIPPQSANPEASYSRRSSWLTPSQIPLSQLRLATITFPSSLLCSACSLPSPIRGPTMLSSTRRLPPSAVRDSRPLLDQRTRQCQSTTKLAPRGKISCQSPACQASLATGLSFSPFVHRSTSLSVPHSKRHSTHMTRTRRARVCPGPAGSAHRRHRGPCQPVQRRGAALNPPSEARILQGQARAGSSWRAGTLSPRCTIRSQRSTVRNC